MWVDIKSDNCSVRRFLALARPSANKILSIILLLPQPLGPDIVVNPFKKGIVISLANDLKLSTSSSFIYINFDDTH